MPELIKIIQSVESKSDLYYCLGYTEFKDVQFTLYEKSKEKNKSYILAKIHDLNEIFKAIDVCKEMGIKRRKDLEPLN